MFKNQRLSLTLNWRQKSPIGGRQSLVATPKSLYVSPLIVSDTKCMTTCMYLCSQLAMLTESLVHKRSRWEYVHDTENGRIFWLCQNKEGQIYLLLVYDLSAASPTLSHAIFSTRQFCYNYWPIGSSTVDSGGEVNLDRSFENPSWSCNGDAWQNCTKVWWSYYKIVTAQEVGQHDT